MVFHRKIFMDSQLKVIVILITLAMCLGIPNPGLVLGKYEHMTEPGNIVPENTVIVANEMEARFSRDFSVLLKHLRIAWVVIDNAPVPDAIRDKNIVLIGNPDSVYTGALMRELLTVEEITTLQSTSDPHIILKIDNPWQKERIIYICSGANFISRKNAAEEVLLNIITDAPPTTDWIRNIYKAELDENLQKTVKQLQYEWEDKELPLLDLTMDLEAKSPRRISAEEAKEDVERLFYLFSHGYSGFAFFNQQGNFEKAKEAVLQELSIQSTWTRDAFSGLLYKHLHFITDCHLTIGEHRFAEHQDFWYDTRLEVQPNIGYYEFKSHGKTYTVLSINGESPSSYLMPSLNKEGEAIYRLGILSTEKPAPLLLIAVNEGKERLFKIKLRRSDYDYISEDIFREDNLGGIPVVRIHSFGDYYADQLNEFAQTATEYRNEAVVIIDIRGNGGGNEHWPISWIQRLTGQRAEAIFISSELECKTSMIGRLNAFNFWYNKKDILHYSDEVEKFTSIVNALESGGRQPSWTSPYYPQLPLIPNNTTVVVVTDGLVASAGEGLVLRISQLENVVVVGENTQGCLTFGNVSMHALPNSGLIVWMPINFGLFPDQNFREEVGLTPDLWIPAADAVNYTVAALHKGTITTAQPLPQATLEQNYTGESHWHRLVPSDLKSWLVITVFALFAMIWAYFNRKRIRLLTGIGTVWCGISLVLIIQRNKLVIGYGLLFGGIIYLVWGLVSLWVKHKSLKTTAAN
jgi:hypothetical protein